MKMKKILSMGALGLVLACSTSVGAMGAPRPTNAEIKEDMKDVFLHDTNALNYDVNGGTKLSNIIDTDKVKTDAANATSYGLPAIKTNSNIYKALTLMDSESSIKKNMINIYTNSDIDITGLLAEVKELTQELKGVENANGEDKFKLEADIKALFKDTNLTVNFGKNFDGKITMSILKGNQVVLQLNSGNAHTINQALNSGDKLGQYAKLLEIFAGNN